MDGRRTSGVPPTAAGRQREGSASSSRPSSSGTGARTSSAAAPMPSRFGFGAAAAGGGSRPSSGVGTSTEYTAAGPSSAARPSTTAARPSSHIAGSLGGLGSSTLATSTNKRSLSGADFGETSATSPSAANGGSAVKRRPPSASLSSRGPTPSPSHDLSALENEYKRREILAQQAYEKLQQECLARGREAEKHKQDRVALLRQWDDLNAEVEEERRASSRHRKDLAERLDEVQKNNRELSEQYSRAAEESAKVKQTLHSTQNELSLRISALETELGLSRNEAENQRQHKERIETQLKAQENDFELERQRARDLPSDQEGSKQLANELSSLLSRTRKLETENLTLSQEVKSLQARKVSVETLKEENRSLQKKVAVAEELRRRFAEEEARRQDLEAENIAWRHIASRNHAESVLEEAHSAFSDPDEPLPSLEEPASLSPDTLMPYVARLQGTVSALLARCRAFNERIGGLKKQCADAEETSRDEQDKCFKLETTLDTAKTARLSSDKSRETMAMELESYKRLLETFQQEAQNMSGQYNASSAEQINLLETQMSSRSEELKRTQHELDEAREALASYTSTGSLSSAERERIESESEQKQKELFQALEEQRSEYAALEKQCESLGKANDDLFARLGRGEFDQSKLRCLELSDNPVRSDREIRTSTLQRLRKENDDLLVQVQELSKRAGSATPQSNGADAGMIPAQTLQNLQVEHTKLQDTMCARDKAFDRLKEAFGAKASEYVAAVKTLFGYDMHVVARGKVKLRSIYARTSKGTSLTFDSADDDVGSMRLVGEARAGAANVAHLKKYWLASTDRSSVPCFLAALQLELYESTTQAARAGWADEEDDDGAA